MVDPDTFPNRDIAITEKFLRGNEQLLALVSMSLLSVALDTEGAVDTDVQDALDSIVRTYRTLESGLYYESRPANLIGGAIQTRVQEEVEKFRKEISAESGMNQIRDKDLLGVFAFLQRMELQQRNGRRLGRAFLDFLRAHFPAPDQPGASPSLITL